MFRFAQSLARIFDDIKVEQRSALARYDMELEDALSAAVEEYPSTWTVRAHDSITLETLTSTSIPVYISTPKANPANPPAGSIVMYLDELGNTLNFNVTYSDGVTTKSGTVALT